jgi:adenine-specific DNA methylase
MTFEQPAVTPKVACLSADESVDFEFDLCVFDPPYYDYIAYPELSEFYRSWLDTPEPSGKPLLPGRDESVERFGADLAACLEAILKKLAPGGLLAFTYHSASSSAWRAIGIALDRAGLLATGLWPIRSDGHMGHHSHPGNCEWDLVIACRRKSECQSAPPPADVDHWVRDVRPLSVGIADRTSMALALVTLGPRFGISTRNAETTGPAQSTGGGTR